LLFSASWPALPATSIAPQSYSPRPSTIGVAAALSNLAIVARHRGETTKIELERITLEARDLTLSAAVAAVLAG
jgi:hypothetical protein